MSHVICGLTCTTNTHYEPTSLAAGCVLRPSGRLLADSGWERQNRVLERLMADAPNGVTLLLFTLGRFLVSAPAFWGNSHVRQQKLNASRDQTGEHRTLKTLVSFVAVQDAL